MSEFYEFYVRAFSIALPVLAVAIGMQGALRANMTGRQIGSIVLVASIVFGLWFAWTVPLASDGVFQVPLVMAEPPFVFAFLFGGSTLIWFLAWHTPLGRKMTEATPLSAIAAFQIPRVMGGVFLVGWLAGDLPALFAVPAALGDIWAGVAGWRASRALAMKAPKAHRLLTWSIVIGIVDFILAVSLGIMTSEGILRIFFVGPNIINDYPLALFPAYFVPVFLGFHFVAVARVRHERPASAAAGST